MDIGFWSKLTKPFFTLAPLANVTDAAFRRVIARYGKPDVTWTEFVSADGLFLARDYLDQDGNPKPEHPLMKDLLFTDAERPIVAQLFTSRPEIMEKAAALCLRLGFDGVDINMGCPDRTIEKQGAGAALIKTPELAQEIIAAAMRGAKMNEGGIPVSVKTRVGYNRVELVPWLTAVLAMKPAALTVHARTRKEMSLVPARWEHVAEAVLLRDQLSPETRLLGNGDALSLEDARQKAAASGADGVMLGRAIFGNPWLFSEKVPSLEEKLRVMIEHTKLFEELLPHKSVAIMKKHYKAYINGFDGAKELRMECMEAKNAQVVAEIVEKFLGSEAR